MNFSTFLKESLLLEGGAAIKTASRVSQVEARHIIPDLVEKIAKATGVSPDQIKRVGSAGKKPHDNDTSGDIDFAVETDSDVLKKALPRLAHDGETWKAMPAINVYSFGAKIHNKVVQVDMVPVSNVDFAEWSYVSDESDLAKGFKGAVRNELMFAVVKYANLKKIKGDSGEVETLERYYFDLSKGLMRGKQTRRNNKGKLTKNFTTVEKDLESDDPKEISRILFGPKANPAKLVTFDQLWKAIHEESFPWKDHLEDIVKMAKEGIKKKGLKLPDVLL